MLFGYQTSWSIRAPCPGGSGGCGVGLGVREETASFFKSGALGWAGDKVVTGGVAVTLEMFIRAHP
jgi:hypothetical protein